MRLVTRLVLLAAALLGLAGCGGGGATAVRAFEMPWPHGTTRLASRVVVPGNVVSVALGALELRERSWSCIGERTRARYTVRGSVVLLRLDDDAASCSGEPRRVPLVGGYASAGGYVGEWSPGAVVYRP